MESMIACVTLLLFYFWNMANSFLIPTITSGTLGWENIGLGCDFIILSYSTWSIFAFTTTPQITSCYIFSLYTHLYKNNFLLWLFQNFCFLSLLFFDDQRHLGKPIWHQNKCSHHPAAPFWVVWIPSVRQEIWRLPNDIWILTIPVSVSSNWG